MKQQPGLGPVMNLDSGAEFVMRPSNQRLTRGQLHRILKVHNVEHDVNWGFAELFNLVRLKGLPLTPIQVGVIEKKEEKVVQMTKDGWPRSTFTLRKWCTERGIPWDKKDKRQQLIEKLDGYKNTTKRG